MLVEGKDEEKFFETLFKEKGIQKIQVMESGGNIQFEKELSEIVKLPDFDKVSSLAVIQDADKNADAAFKRVCSVLQKNNLNPPNKPALFTSNALRVGVFIISGENNQGMLESLCLSTMESKGLKECIDSFMECVKKTSSSNEDTGYKKPKNLHKARCRAFLAAMEDDTPSLGVAAQKGYWNFSSDKMKPLLDFLKNLEKE